MNFFITERESAKSNFEQNLSVPCDEFMKFLENADSQTVIGAKVTGKSLNGLWLTFGHDSSAYLERRRCAVKRKFWYMDNIKIGDYINVHILTKADDGVFFVSRDTIIHSAQEFHKANSIGRVINGKVLDVTDFFAEVEIGAGVSATVHVSKIHDAFVQSLNDYFFPEQTISVLIEGWSDEFNGFVLKYDGIRQPMGLKTGTVVQACVSELLEGKKCKCYFPDYPTAEGVITQIPRGYKLKENVSMVPVNVIDIRKNIGICKF